MRPSLPRLGTAAAAALLAACGLARAADYQTVPCHTMRTVNATQSRVWVTIYDLLKTRHLDYGWVDACSFRDWQAGSYACGSYYYVRGEVKNYTGSANVYDTTIQVHPMMTGAFTANPSNVVTLNKGQGNYYWTTGANISDASGQVQACDLTPPQGAPSLTFKVTNETLSAINVTVKAARTGQVLASNLCMQSQEEKTWPVTELAYAVHADLLLGACGSQKVDSVDSSVTATPANKVMGVQLFRRITANPYAN